jgi:hypothetical protein
MEILEFLKSQNVDSKEKLLTLIKTFRRQSGLPLPKGYDDSENPQTAMDALEPATLLAIGIQPPQPALPVTRPMPGETGPTDMLNVSIRVIMTSDSDGTHEPLPGIEDTVLNHVIEANQVWMPRGVHLIFDPAVDVEHLNNTFLNRDMTVTDSLLSLGAVEIQHVVYLGQDGKLEWLNGLESWSAQQIAGIGGVPAAAGDPIFFSSDAKSVEHVVYRSEDGHLHELIHGGAWQHRNLTTLHKDDLLPLANSDPYAYESSGGMQGPFIIYTGLDGHIYEITLGSPLTHLDLTRAAGAPLSEGKSIGYVADGGFRHVFYRGVDRQIHAIRLTFDDVSGRNHWQHEALTQGSPGAQDGPTVYVADTEHVLYMGFDGHIHQVTNRVDEDLTPNAGMEGAAPPPDGPAIGLVTDDYGHGIPRIAHVIYRSANGHLHELAKTDDRWHARDLTRDTNAPFASSDPSGYSINNEKDWAVVYRGEQNHVHQIFSRGDHVIHGDLTAQSGGITIMGKPSAYLAWQGDPWAYHSARNRIARETPNKLTIFFSHGTSLNLPEDQTRRIAQRRGGGFSSSLCEYIAMPSVYTNTSLAHEFGHFLHLDHTFTEPLAKNVEDLADLIRRVSVQGLDADRPHVLDTPPDPGPSVYTGRDYCGNAFIVIPVDGNLIQFSPDVQNVMSYFGCTPAHLSDQQAKRAIGAIRTGNRKRLIENA